MESFLNFYKDKKKKTKSFKKPDAYKNINNSSMIFPIPIYINQNQALLRNGVCSLS